MWTCTPSPIYPSSPWGPGTGTRALGYRGLGCKSTFTAVRGIGAHVDTGVIWGAREIPIQIQKVTFWVVWGVWG